MLTLLTYPQKGPAFSLSPFCVKAALLLTHAGVEWKRQDLGDPRTMPHRKLPVLRSPERLIADSTGIRLWLEARGTDFDKGLSDRERAWARALIRMAEDSLYFHVVHDRWVNDDVWPTIRDAYFADVPRLIRHPVTWRIRRVVRKGLAFQGIARFSDVERAARLEQDLETLQCLLEEREFLMGELPTSADFSVAPMLEAMRTTPVETPLVRRIRQDGILGSYVDRVFQQVPLP